jgi:hypothetical protein
VTTGQINDVDVITYSSTIFALVVTSKHVQVRQLATCDPLYVGH